MFANRTSRWSIGAGLLCLVLLAATWFLLISPRRADAAGVRSQTVAADSQAAVLRVQIAELKADYASLKDRKAELAAIKLQLPPKANVPAFVRDLQKLAAQSGVSLDSITAGAPLVLGGAGATGPVPAGSVVAIPISVVVTGYYFEDSLFLKYLQTKIKRSFLIAGLAGVPYVPVATPGASTPTATTTATATAAPVVVATTEAAKIDTLKMMSLTLTGSAFVLMDGTTTLDQVAGDAKAATAGTQAATAGPTTAPVAGSTVAAR